LRVLKVIQIGRTGLVWPEIARKIQGLRLSGSRLPRGMHVV